MIDWDAELQRGDKRKPNVLLALPMRDGETVERWLSKAEADSRLAARWSNGARVSADPADTSYCLDTALVFARQAVERLEGVIAGTRA
jgi:hypothetical protein